MVQNETDAADTKPKKIINFYKCSPDMWIIMGSLAEFERSLVRERTLVGLKYAKEVKGKRLGAPEKYSKDLILKLGEQGLTYPEICKLVGSSEATVSRHLRRLVQKRPA